MCSTFFCYRRTVGRSKGFGLYDIQATGGCKRNAPGSALFAARWRTAQFERRADALGNRTAPFGAIAFGCQGTNGSGLCSRSVPLAYVQARIMDSVT